jgi:hypothetical protein
MQAIVPKMEFIDVWILLGFSHNKNRDFSGSLTPEYNHLQQQRA